jgi:hypothetical protein
MVFP